MTPFFRNHFKIYKDTYANNFRHVLSSDQYQSTGGYIPQVFALVYNCYSVFRKVANIHSFGALVTIQWGISDRLSISDQINKKTHFITKHIVIKLQYNNYIVMQGLSETCI